MNDDIFISKAITIIDEINRILTINIGDSLITDYEQSLSPVAYDKAKKKFRTHALDTQLEKLNELLRVRFNVNFSIKPITNPAKPAAYIVTPPLNYKTLALAKDRLDDIYGSNGLLWNITASTFEKRAYGILKEMRDALKTDGIEISLDRLYVNPSIREEIPIYINFLKLFLLKLKSIEVLSIILHEVGHLFTYLEFSFSTSRQSYLLIDKFLKEKFNKGKPPFESFRLAYKETMGLHDLEKPDSPLVIIDDLKTFFIKTYKLDKSRKSVMVDFERLADRIVVKLGLGDVFSKAIIKVYSNSWLANEVDENSSQGFFITLIVSISKLIAFIFFLLFFGIFSIVILTFYIMYKAISLIVMVIVNVLSKIISVIFGKDIDTNNTHDDVITRLKKIRLETIKMLRSLEPNDKTGKEYLVKTIDVINKSIQIAIKNISLVDPSKAKIDRYADTDPNELFFNMLEDLNENSFWYYSAKFNINN